MGWVGGQREVIHDDGNLRLTLFMLVWDCWSWIIVLRTFEEVQQALVLVFVFKSG